MILENMDIEAPLFDFADAAAFAGSDTTTLENYVRWDRLTPQKIGRKRMFSFRQVMHIALTNRLAKTFRIEPSTGILLAELSFQDYLPMLDSDISSIAAGTSPYFYTKRTDSHHTIKRDPDTGETQIITLEEGEVADSVMLIVPVGGIARQVLARIRDSAVTTAEAGE
jgi:hypothetical protein|tara:strand:+ start:3417 stop:3920 length:504 start_codon:yes stop_codon:yes gene_type:complete